MTVLLFGSWYLYVGALVAIVFLVFVIGRFDGNAEGAWVFRPLLIPGAMLIWPLVLWRGYVLWRGEEKMDRHRMPRIGQERVALAMICAVPLIIVVAFALRQDPDTLAQPVLIEASQ